MLRNFAGRTAWIAGIRLSAFLCGWWLTTRYGDWRQVAGYPLLFFGALPDAAWVRYAVGPKSPHWPWAMAVSLVVSSALVAAASMRLRRRTMK